MKNAGKKLISLSCALAVLSSGAINALALAPSDYDGQSYESLGYTSEDPDGVINLAVIAKNNVNIYGDAMLIEGSVYSNGTINVGDGQGNKIKGIFISGTDGSVLEDEANGLSRKCEGYIHVNDNGTTDGITYYSTQPDVLGGSIMDKETSFECAYTPFDIPEIANDLGDTEMTVYYNDVWDWSPELGSYSKPGPNAPKTITEDTHIGALKMDGTQNNWRNLDAALIIDTTEGDVTVVIDSLPNAVNPSIKVVGGNRANIYISDVNILKNLALNYNTNHYDSNYQMAPELNGSTENTYVYLTGEDIDIQNCWIGANTIYVNGTSLTVSGSSNIVSNIETGANAFTITGGATEVHGIVCAPNADSEVVDSGTLYGQLHTDTLTINGSGRILWHTDSEYAVKEPETTAPIEETTTEPASEETTVAPTEESTTAPTEEEPTTEPETEKPNLPSGKPINLYGVNYAYIFGYEPEIKAVTVTDEEGNTTTKYVADIYMGPQDAVTREQTAAMIMRLVDQKLGTMDEVYPVTDNISKHEGAWYERGLAYLASKGTFDGIETVNVGPVTRGEVAKLVCFGLNLSDGAETSFTDIANSEFKPYIEIMANHGYMNGVSDTIFEPDRVMTRAEFCKMFNNIIGREEMGLEAADGTEVTCELYSIVDLAGHWAEETMLKATSAYDKDGFVDVDTRLRNIRNTLDWYESQKLY